MGKKRGYGGAGKGEDVGGQGVMGERRDVGRRGVLGKEGHGGKGIMGGVWGEEGV